MGAIQRLRLAIREDAYGISSHGNEEISEDDLSTEDVERIILGGEVIKKYTHDPRGTRYEVAGRAVDGREASVVCRFLPSGTLLIITAYAAEE